MRVFKRGELIFWGAFALALSLYSLTAPEGIPWHPTQFSSGLFESVWRYFVAMFNGNAVALSSTAAAVAGGFIGVLVNRYSNAGVAMAASLVWTALPAVWNRAVTGERSICLVAAAVVALWALNALVLSVTRRARCVCAKAASAATHAQAVRRAKVNRVLTRILLGAAVLFAFMSALRHDSLLGEVASAYAKTIVDEADGRIVILNGICDEQIEREIERSAQGVDATGLRFILPRLDDAYRSNLVAWVRREWPCETNLHVAAQIGPTTFARQAVNRFPGRFYAMDGSSTTPAKWAARWKTMSPYLASSDPFVPVMRRAFAYEGNALGNALVAAAPASSLPDEAWALYLRVFDEIEPHNLAACANLNLLLRRGCRTDDLTRSRIESEQADFMKRLADGRQAPLAASLLAASGPVMRDEKAYEEMRARVVKRLAELELKGVRPQTPPALRTLSEWHAEMMRAYYAKDIAVAARIARAILSQSRWRGFAPAHMVLGTALAAEGDYAASEAFYRVVLAGKGAAMPPRFVLNDYADVLRNLRRFDEAETFARKAIEGTQEREWLYRLTLAQILRDAGRGGAEMDALVQSVMTNAPIIVRKRLQGEFTP